MRAENINKHELAGANQSNHGGCPEEDNICDL